MIEYRTRILIVDDQIDFSDLVAQRIRKLDHSIEVETANSGWQAAIMIEAGSFNLIISDIEMPAGNGIWLLDYVRSYHPSSKVLLMSARLFEIEQSGFLTGAVGLFDKLQPLNRLAHQVQTILSKSA
jgi:DNA-binding NtrC family response regulator